MAQAVPISQATPRLKNEELLVDRAYVGGEWIDADSGETFPVTNPATGDELARVPRLGARETRRAIEAAGDALPAWRFRVAKERAAIMRRWSDLMLEHLDDLALLLTLEQGKPLAESRTEIAYAVTMLENGPTICSHQNGKAGRVGRSHSRENRINLFFDGRF